jgi:hypothetical protein
MCVHRSVMRSISASVPKARFELARDFPPPPQDGASTNFATWARTNKERAKVGNLVQPDRVCFLKDL